MVFPISPDVSQITITVHIGCVFTFTEVLMKKFAEAKGVDLSTLTFQFDGEELSLTETPADHDMEEGDCVDVTGY